MRNFNIYWQIKIQSAKLDLVNLSIVLLKRHAYTTPDPHPNPVNCVYCIFMQMCQYTYMHIYTYIKIALEAYHIHK